MNRLIQLLEQLELDMSAEDIADAIWLANQIQSPSVVAPVDEVNQLNQISQPEIYKSPQPESSQNLDSSTGKNTQETTAKAYTKNDIDSNSTEKSKPPSPGVPFKAPATSALPNALEIGALASLLWRINTKMPV